MCPWLKLNKKVEMGDRPWNVYGRCVPVILWWIKQGVSLFEYKEGVSLFEYKEGVSLIKLNWGVSPIKFNWGLSAICPHLN